MPPGVPLRHHGRMRETAGTGEAADRARVRVGDDGHLEVSWRQREWFRVLLAVGTVAALVVLPAYLRDQGWDGRLTVGGGVMLELHSQDAMLYVAVALLPVMRLVSYRKRDVLLVALVPLYQLFLVGRIVYRLSFLPLRDWRPRPDEVPEVTSVGFGVWVKERLPRRPR
jgi:hypothetical protein